MISRRMNSAPDTLIRNCGQLVTVAGASQRPKTLREMDGLGIITDGAVAVKDGVFIDVGTTKRLKRKYAGKDMESIDAGGMAVLPGFVDSHTHAVFGGDRAGEFVRRIEGETYREISKKGGGILHTVENTRKLTPRKLIEASERHLDVMLLHGTTTVEIKSGYGLDLDNELKILKAIHNLKKTHPLDIVPTFLGAHAVPLEYRQVPDRYVDSVCDMLPKARPYADFCDVFCDEGAFSAEQSEKILKTAKAMGFGLKIHTNEFRNVGGIPLAGKLGVVSADHLDNIEHRDIVKLKKEGVLCVLLPGVPFFLMRNTYAPGKRLLEAGVPVALATDFNPGTCPCGNMQMMIALACLKLGMTPAQAINAATINGAHAVGMAHRLGSIEAGKQADLIILDVLDYNHLPYYFGTNHVTAVVKKGKLVVENKRLVNESCQTI